MDGELSICHVCLTAAFKPLLNCAPCPDCCGLEGIPPGLMHNPDSRDWVYIPGGSRCCPYPRFLTCPTCQGKGMLER